MELVCCTTWSNVWKASDGSPKQALSYSISAVVLCSWITLVWHHEDYDASASFRTAKESEKYQKHLHLGTRGSRYVKETSWKMVCVSFEFWKSMGKLMRFIKPEGKTTIADALVASNGIISQRLAGKVSIIFLDETSKILKPSYVLLYCRGHFMVAESTLNLLHLSVVIKFAVCVCVCVCMCERASERASERQRACVCVCVWGGGGGGGVIGGFRNLRL